MKKQWKPAISLGIGDKILNKEGKVVAEVRMVIPDGRYVTVIMTNGSTDYLKAYAEGYNVQVPDGT